MNNNLINLNADHSTIVTNGFERYCQDTWMFTEKLSTGDSLIVVIYNDKTIRWIISGDSFMKESENLKNQNLRIKLLIEAYNILTKLEDKKIFLIK